MTRAGWAGVRGNRRNWCAEHAPKQVRRAGEDGAWSMDNGPWEIEWVGIDPLPPYRADHQRVIGNSRAWGRSRPVQAPGIWIPGQSAGHLQTEGGQRRDRDHRWEEHGMCDSEREREREQCQGDPAQDEEERRGTAPGAMTTGTAQASGCSNAGARQASTRSPARSMHLPRKHTNQSGIWAFPLRKCQPVPYTGLPGRASHPHHPRCTRRTGPPLPPCPCR
jgi:hypothetical protein